MVYSTLENGTQLVQQELTRIIKILRSEENQLSELERDDFTIKRNILNRILALLARKIGRAKEL
jgi:hypothetical protein